MQTFDVLAALLALVMLARHAGRVRLLWRPPPPGQGGPGRAAGAVSFLNCLGAGAVLWVAVKGLLRGLMTPPGGIP